VNRKKRERYSQEFRIQAIERMKACDKILRLSREFGMHHRMLYHWRDGLEESNPGPRRFREFILREEITKLKRLLANKTQGVRTGIIARESNRYCLQLNIAPGRIVRKSI